VSLNKLLFRTTKQQSRLLRFLIHAHLTLSMSILNHYEYLLSNHCLKKGHFLTEFRTVLRRKAESLKRRKGNWKENKYV